MNCKTILNHIGRMFLYLVVLFFVVVITVVMFGLGFRLLNFIGIEIRIDEIFFIGGVCMLVFSAVWIWQLDNTIKRMEKLHKAETDYQSELIQRLRNDRRRIPRADVLKLDFIRNQAH